MSKVKRWCVMHYDAKAVVYAGGSLSAAVLAWEPGTVLGRGDTTEIAVKAATAQADRWNDARRVKVDESKGILG